MAEKKFAVLIDADNTSHKYLKVIFDEITNEGIVTYKRIYGDWTNEAMKNYKPLLLKYAVTPIQQYSYTTGKNATDSAMIIDAMDILHEKSVDGFCLVSSDSDFTRLATRLREGGMTVIGMGRKQTPQPFVGACNSFKYLDVLAGEPEAAPAPAPAPAAAPEAKSAKKAPKKSAKKAEAAETPAAPAEVSAPAPVPAPIPAEEKSPREEIREVIVKIIEEQSDAEGWLLASTLGNLLQNKVPDFDCRNFGCKKMADLLQELGFEVRRVKNPSGITTVYVKIKE